MASTAAAAATTTAQRRARTGPPKTRAMRVATWALLCVAVVLATPARAQDVPDPIDEEWIKKYLEEDYELSVTQKCNMLNNAEWTYETNINPDTEEALQTATLDYAAYEKEQWENVFSKVNHSGFQDEALKRQLDSLKVLGIPALPEEDLILLTSSTSNMTGIYSTAKICPYKKQNCSEAEKLSLDPGIEGVLVSSRDYDELVYVWEAWRNVTGKLMRNNYEIYVNLSNKAASKNDFADMGEMWRHDYDSDNLKDEMLKLWETISPLYDELHTYVSRRLKAHYTQLNTSRGLLPAHIFGNMWAQSWINIFDLVKPFPNGTAVDVTQSLVDQGYDAERMFEMSDEFYKSLGLEDNAMSYGEKAMITKPNDREVVCHASAWDFCNGADFRIKMCTKVNMEDFVTIHHEMGHIQYFILYKGQPYVFRKGANPGFHEAVGDTIALSVSTPKHLKEVGLLETDYPDTYEDNINSLMSMALQKVAFLPFGLLIDMWRWDVFSGNVTKNQWNAHWWELRETIQRVEAPIPRSEEDFDPGAKFHVPGDSQYIAYFIAHVLQFQFHKAVCTAAGQYDPNNVTEPLHKCDIFHSEEAGKLLRKGLELGGAASWRDALEAITGLREYSGEALLEYFQPLYEFLRKENEVTPEKKSQLDPSPQKEPTSQLVPITVGAVIGGVLICTLVGYIIMRSRANKRSISVISANTGSKTLP